eukprot:9425578-Pyramimonas_sp.AAC.1
MVDAIGQALSASICRRRRVAAVPTAGASLRAQCDGKRRGAADAGPGGRMARGADIFAAPVSQPDLREPGPRRPPTPTRPPRVSTAPPASRESDGERDCPASIAASPGSMPPGRPNPPTEIVGVGVDAPSPMAEERWLHRCNGGAGAVSYRPSARGHRRAKVSIVDAPYAKAPCADDEELERAMGQVGDNRPWRAVPGRAADSRRMRARRLGCK